MASYGFLDVVVLACTAGCAVTIGPDTFGTQYGPAHATVHDDNQTLHSTPGPEDEPVTNLDLHVNVVNLRGHISPTTGLLFDAGVEVMTFQDKPTGDGIQYEALNWVVGLVHYVDEDTQLYGGAGFGWGCIGGAAFGQACKETGDLPANTFRVVGGLQTRIGTLHFPVYARIEASIDAGQSSLLIEGLRFGFVFDVTSITR